MTPEELLKPRYEVIATWPGCLYNIGDILIHTGDYFSLPDGRLHFYYGDPCHYPANFRPLAWWEHRKREELQEYEAFTVGRTSSGKMAFPITKQPRLYTQAEAEEIWRAGYDCGHAEAAREDYIDKEQYFKTRFNVEL